MILTDMSRYSCGMRCRRERLWRYEYENPDGTFGLERNELSLFLHFGKSCHKALAAVRSGAPVDSAINEASESFVQEAYSRGMIVEVPDDVSFVIAEQAALLEALVRAWSKVRLPSILYEYELISVEKEGVEKMDEFVGLMFRCDTVERRRATGEIFIRNYETVSDPNEAWRRKFDTDVQCISEPWAVEQSVGPVSGVIVEGLAKGRRKKLKTPDGFTWRVQQQSPLIYGNLEYRSKEKVPVWDVQTGFEGGVKEWIETVPIEILFSQFSEIEISRHPPQVTKSWADQVVIEETCLRNDRSAFGNRLMCWPQNHSACSGYGTEMSKCEFYDLCWSGPESMKNYRPRIANHEKELERLCQLPSCS